MKRASLVCLLLNAWALSCSPVPPNPQIEAATGRLQAATTLRTCRTGNNPLNDLCYTQYSLSGTETLNLIQAAFPGAEVRQKGEYWQLRWPDWTGQTATLHALPAGSISATIDRQTAFETLEQQLGEASQRALKAAAITPQHCRFLGLIDSPQMRYAACGVNTAKMVRPTIWVKLAFASDSTLHTGRFYTYMPFGPDCQGGRIIAVPPRS